MGLHLPFEYGARRFANRVFVMNDMSFDLISDGTLLALTMVCKFESMWLWLIINRWGEYLSRNDAIGL